LKKEVRRIDIINPAIFSQCRKVEWFGEGMGISRNTLKKISKFALFVALLGSENQAWCLSRLQKDQNGISLTLAGIAQGRNNSRR
jgi:hypothetical protein